MQQARLHAEHQAGPEPSNSNTSLQNLKLTLSSCAQARPFFLFERIESLLTLIFISLLVGMYVHTYPYTQTRREHWVSCSNILPYSLKQDLSENLEPGWWAPTSASSSPTPTPLYSARIPGIGPAMVRFLHGSVQLNFGPCAYIASTLSILSCPLSPQFILFGNRVSLCRVRLESNSESFPCLKELGRLSP